MDRPTDRPTETETCKANGGEEGTEGKEERENVKRWKKSRKSVRWSAAPDAPRLI